MKKNKLLFATALLVGSQSINAAVVNNYAYDTLGRLTSVSNSQDVSTEAYRYDGVGNIVQKTIDGETYRLSYDTAHQLKSAEGSEGLREFTYDKAGRLVTEVLNGQPAVNYTYGYLDKVIAVERNGEVTRFDYDAQGMLVGKQLPDGSYEHWIWDGMALVARGEERYINERHITGGLPIVSQTSEGVQYHQHDHLGTTVASYSQDGAIISAYETTVFGQGELEDSRTARFTGKPYDADLGAYVFPFRNYDPEAARWLSADPSGFPDGPNQHYYACVPTMGVDPLGLWSLVDESDLPHSNVDWYIQNNLITSNLWVRYSFDWSVRGSHSFNEGDANVSKSVSGTAGTSWSVGGSGGGFNLNVGGSVTVSSGSDITLENATSDTWENINGWKGSVLVLEVTKEWATLTSGLTAADFDLDSMFSSTKYSIGDNGVRYEEQ